MAGRRTDVRFLVASSFDYGTNMGSFAGRLYQATYVLGTIAGSVTTTNTVAIVGPRATPEMVLSANAFARGALALNPNTAIIVHWTGSWRSAAQPPGEFIAIDLLVGELGADVVYNLTDTHAPLIYLSTMQDGDRGNGEFPEGTPPVLGMGSHDADACRFAPDTCVAAAATCWATIVFSVLRDMASGSWLPSSIDWIAMSSTSNETGVIVEGPNPELVDREVVVNSADTIEAISTSEVGLTLPFGGTVLDADGNERFGAGASPDDEALQSMCWYVSGLIDTDEAPTTPPEECEQSLSSRHK